MTAPVRETIRSTLPGAAVAGFLVRLRAPVSGVEILLEYQGRWIAEARSGSVAVWAEVMVPVKSLCPCSKEISDYGAHNQRSHVTVRVELKQAIEWTELVRFAEDSASKSSRRSSIPAAAAIAIKCSR